MTARGFVVIHRSIFANSALAGKYSRREAWIWLIAQAAYKPEGRRGPWGVVHLERGELPISLSMLAEIWGWPRSTVRGFLDRLKRERMVCCKNTRTADRTPDGPQLEYELTILSISKYEKFQTISDGGESGAAPQTAPQTAPQDDGNPAIPGLLEPLNNLTNEQLRLRIGEPGERRSEAQRAPKRHGLTSARHGTVYLHKGTEDWRIHAADYRETIGAEPLPDRDGGFWFYIKGEAARPAHQRHWRKVRFGPA